MQGMEEAGLMAIKRQSLSAFTAGYVDWIFVFETLSCAAAYDAVELVDYEVKVRAVIKSFGAIANQSVHLMG